MKASTTILALSALVASTSAKPISRMISVKMPAGTMANKMTSDSMVRREAEMGAAATTPAVPENPTAAPAPKAVLESAKINENPSPAQKDEAKVALDKLEEVKGTVSDAKGKIHAVMEMEGDVDMDALKTIVNDVNMKITGNSNGGDKTGSQPGKTGSQPGRPRKETFNLSGLEGFDLEALGFGDVDVNNLTEAELREINEVLDLGIDVDALVASIRN
ncbi:Splicing factor U2AF-associated protein 2 [Verticillium dahliae VDG1]|nr:Splicing factor U2AF-associated protein 2 [Verticillium dahliae VDG1]